MSEPMSGCRQCGGSGYVKRTRWQSTSLPVSGGCLASVSYGVFYYDVCSCQWRQVLPASDPAKAG